MVLIKNIVIATVGLILAIMLYSVAAPGAILQLANKTPAQAPAATTTAPAPAPVLVSYENTTFGLTFAYPQDYTMKEVDLSDAFHKHDEITLTRTADAVPPQNGEAPPGIMIDVYQNDSTALSLNQWLAASSSNYSLASGGYASTTLAGEEAVQYHWSGLYEADTTAFIHRGNIIAITVTYISPEDENVSAYRQLLENLRLQ